MNEEILKKLEDLDKRLKKVEEFLFVEKKSVNPLTKEYHGLTGGIRLLIEKGFLNEPKSLDDITKELDSEGYHYPKDSVSKMLSVDFLQKAKLLTRKKQNNVWVYSLRK